MKVFYGKEYDRKAKSPVQHGMVPEDRDRCIAAVDQFLKDPRHPSLKFKRLRRNHWSIRASDDLRIILAAEGPPHQPNRVALLNMGRHDPMYEWAERRNYNTDFDAQGEVWHAPAARGGNSAAPPADFEEWTLYLPDQQRRLANRHYPKGMGRIRGGAGTGKTVVALHRAIVLGTRYPRDLILVTTFSRSLVNHMKSLFERFPDRPNNVEFRSLHSLAGSAIYRQGTPVNIRKRAVDDAFDAAYDRVVSQRWRSGRNRDYLREEIERVIKGRDATRDEYLDTGRFERLGRLRPFKRPMRQTCWRLREEWDREMAKLGTISYDDLLVMGRDAARRLRRPRYRAAIVDEAHNVTLVGMQFVRALVAGSKEGKLRRDSILVLDDAAQRIYPGGFHPKWAELDFRGSSSFLGTNFRNTKAIYQAAQAVRGDYVIAKDDNDDGTAGDVAFERDEGRRPGLIMAPDGEVLVVLKWIRWLVDKGKYKFEQIGVFARRNADVRTLVGFLGRNGCPASNLEDLKDSSLGPGVRVGTFDRVQGMEFRAVLIPRLGESLFPVDENQDAQLVMAVAEPKTDSPPDTDDMREEERRLSLDRLYVGMTRARDRLYLIANEQPCPEIQRAVADGYVDQLPSPYPVDL